MRPGTPNFNGRQLRDAREARGLTAVGLADLIGLTRASVSSYERGLSTPSPDAMQRIVAVLNLPPQFFWDQGLCELSEPIFYRSMSAATKAARTRAERRFNWLRRIVRFLRDFVEYPHLDFPSPLTPGEPLRLSNDSVERIALDLRAAWRLGSGPVANMAWLLENHGVIVSRSNLDAETLDAFSAWVDDDGTPYVFLGADKGSAVRSRLDAAHELGHMVLHRNLDRTALGRAGDFKRIEEQAKHFAAAFLLPADAFAADLRRAPTLDTFRVLKSKWLVSIGAMIARAEELDLISAEQAQQLWRQRAWRRWTKWEPLDDDIPVEEPRVIRRAIELVLNERVVTREELLDSLPYAPSDIESLTGLSVGYLSDAPPNVRPLKVRETSQAPTEPGSGQISQFRPRR